MGLASPLRYFRNTGSGRFAEDTAAAGLTGLTGGLNLVSGDYDNDGRVDVLVLRGGWMGAAGAYPRSLLRNLGGGRFEDVTEAAGLLEAEPSQTAAWFDFDGDGWLDLFVGHESVPARLSVCRLYWNNRRGGFVECAAPAGVAVSAFVKGVAAGDYNNDGRPDLYLSLRDAPNRLFRNEGPAGPDRPTGPAAPAGSGGGTPPRWRFTDSTAAAGVAEPVRSFPTWFFDYDNDGWLDLFVGGYGVDSVGDVVADVLGRPSAGERPRLYRNRRDGTFAEVSRAVRLDRVILGMGGNFGDLDNDGWLDLYLGTGDPEFTTLVSNRMFRNDAGRRFQDVTTAGGFGHLQKGHGVSFADLDNDGDQDIYHVLGGAYSGDVYRNALFRNPGHTNHWITLKLEGTRANRGGLGARVKLVVAGRDGTREIHRVAGTGGSFGCNPTLQ
ncbi:MAG: FG-GAP repeat domain-containing protein [Verrucomicrobiota bacterium]